MIYIVINIDEALKPTNDYVFKRIFGKKGNEDIPKAHTKWEIREEEFMTKLLTDVFEIHIIELAKLKKQIAENRIDKKDKLLQWATFMLYPEKIGDEIVMENVEMKKAVEEWTKIDQSKEEREIAWRRLVSIMDENSIKESGYQDGLKDGKAEIARKLLEMKLPIEQIIEATGLTEEEIEKLKED